MQVCLIFLFLAVGHAYRMNRESQSLIKRNSAVQRIRLPPIFAAKRSYSGTNRGKKVATLPPEGNYLLPTPAQNSIGNFFDDKVKQRITFIQCNMVAVGVVEGEQYGVGYPMDIPVMITHFDGTEFKPVTESSYPQYDHLIDYISMQLDNNNIQLLKTPMCLTLAGEFEDEELNDLFPNSKGSEEEGEDEEDFEDDDDDEDLSFEEIVRREDARLAEEEASENYEDDEDDKVENFEMTDEEEEDEDEEDDGRITMLQDDEDEYDDELGDDEDQQAIDDYLSEDERNFDKQVAALNPALAETADYTLFRTANPDLSQIDPEAFVTDEDAKSLHRAHKRADRILEYAEDVKLMASFHYRKQNFHLVRLLEPLIIFGKRMSDIKGYYFTLLDHEQSDQVRPALEQLLNDQLVSTLQTASAIESEQMARQEQRQARRGLKTSESSNSGPSKATGLDRRRSASSSRYSAADGGKKDSSASSSSTSSAGWARESDDQQGNDNGRSSSRESSRPKNPVDQARTSAHLRAATARAAVSTSSSSVGSSSAGAKVSPRRSWLKSKEASSAPAPSRRTEGI